MSLKYEPAWSALASPRNSHSVALHQDAVLRELDTDAVVSITRASRETGIWRGADDTGALTCVSYTL